MQSFDCTQKWWHDVSLCHLMYIKLFVNIWFNLFNNFFMNHLKHKQHLVRVCAILMIWLWCSLSTNYKICINHYMFKITIQYLLGFFHLENKLIYLLFTIHDKFGIFFDYKINCIQLSWLNIPILYVVLGMKPTTFKTSVIKFYTKTKTSLFYN